MKTINWMGINNIDVCQNMKELRAEDPFFKKWRNRSQLISDFIASANGTPTSGEYPWTGWMNGKDPDCEVYTLYKLSNLGTDMGFIDALNHSYSLTRHYNPNAVISLSDLEDALVSDEILFFEDNGIDYLITYQVD